MKKIILFISILFIYLVSYGQILSDLYKTGKIILEQDKNFAKEMDWNKIFPDSKAELDNKNVEKDKSIAIAPDGSIFVTNYNSYSIHKFSSEGKFLFSFGKKGSTEGDFINRPTLGGVVGEKYVFTHENKGHIKLFSLDGTYIKTIVLDYGPTKTFALTSNKIAVICFVTMKKNARYVVTIIDPETGNKQIIKRFDDVWQDNTLLTITKNKGMYSFWPSFTKVDVIARPLPNGNLIIGVTNRKTIEEYSPEGKLIKSFELDFSPLPYPYELKDEFIKTQEQKVTEGKFSKEDIAPIYNENFFPKNMPYYYNILVDSDGNILVFKFVDEDVDHEFSVYSYNSNGKRIANTNLEVEGYKLGLHYRFEEIVFFNGKIIGLLNSSENINEPMTLVKFNIKGDLK
ncbi:MAG: hypothetical protein AB7S50_14290 [Bacteroidales bacterium]